MSKHQPLKSKIFETKNIKKSAKEFIVNVLSRCFSISVSATKYFQKNILEKLKQVKELAKFINIVSLAFFILLFIFFRSTEMYALIKDKKKKITSIFGFTMVNLSLNAEPPINNESLKASNGKTEIEGDSGLNIDGSTIIDSDYKKTYIDNQILNIDNQEKTK